jgi:tryptophanyl-tRNA synthetase
VGEDQVPHVELTREIARRFNHLYGRETDFEEKAEESAKKLGGKRARLLLELRTRFQEQGDESALEQAKALLQESQNLTLDDRERLFGYLEGARRLILVEPQALLTEASRMPGLDGQKMSKSYNNTIGLREDPDVVAKKIRTMPTDPARIRRTDPGTPEKCPVWAFHQIYSDEQRQDWVQQGCRSAGIGCIECKQPVIDAVIAEQDIFRARAKPFEKTWIWSKILWPMAAKRPENWRGRPCAMCARSWAWTWVRTEKDWFLNDGNCKTHSRQPGGDCDAYAPRWQPRSAELQRLDRLAHQQRHTRHCGCWYHR